VEVSVLVKELVALLVSVEVDVDEAVDVDVEDTVLVSEELSVEVRVVVNVDVAVELTVDVAVLVNVEEAVVLNVEVTVVVVVVVVEVVSTTTLSACFAAESEINVMLLPDKSVPNPDATDRKKLSGRRKMGKSAACILTMSALAKYTATICWYFEKLELFWLISWTDSAGAPLMLETFCTLKAAVSRLTLTGSEKVSIRRPMPASTVKFNSIGLTVSAV